MTSEIVIANKSAIVMAADSALSIGKNKKIFTSSNKLFMIKKPHPVGIMIYGNSELVSTPWEIIIKIYRKEQREEPWPHVIDYVVKFKNWIANQDRFYPESKQKETVNIECFGVIEHEILDMINEKLDLLEDNDENANNDCDAKLFEITEEVINKTYLEYRKSKFLDDYKENDIKRLIKLYDDDLNKAIDEQSSEITLNDSQKEKIKEVTISSFIKSNITTYSSSNIVIAGYGEDDLFSSIYHFEIRGVIDNKLIIENLENHSISHDKPIFIRPYAQDDMIVNFIAGVHPSYQEWINEYIDKISNNYFSKFKEFIGNLKPTNSEKIIDELEEFKKKEIIKFKEKQEDVISSIFSPILSLIESLPKEELAIMAETLISIQTFKKRVSYDSETVGGPIDVAIISKGEGFIWIKRKHYFKPELNPDYMKKFK